MLATFFHGLGSLALLVDLHEGALDRLAVIVDLAQHKVSPELALALHLDRAVLDHTVAVGRQRLLGSLADVDLHGLAGRLHAVGHVHRVAKQTVSRPK